MDADTAPRPHLVGAANVNSVMPRILDVEQALLLLELEPPFDQRTVQLARRRMAKRWHPDIAPPGRQHEHQRHLQAINEAADQLEQLAESSRGGKVSRNAVKVSAAATRKARAEEGRRAYEAEQRQRTAGRGAPEARPVRLARPRPLGRPPLRPLHVLSGMGRRHRDRDLLLGRRGRRPAVGPGEVRGRRPDRSRPARSSSSTSPSPTRPPTGCERFMTAAQHALAEGDAALAAQRLIYARDADPTNPVVLRLLTGAFWQAGNLPAAARAVRDWARAETDRPTPERFAARIYEDMGAIDLAAEAAERAARPRARPTPRRGSGSDACGCG